MNTNALRELIASRLNTTTGATWYRLATDKSHYPYKVYDLGPMVFRHAGRYDYTLTVDIYDRHADLDHTAIEALADQVQDLFLEQVNLPQQTILPTFWLEDRQPVDDPDVELQRIQLRFTVQVYDV